MKRLVFTALWGHNKPLIPPAPSRRFHFPGLEPLDERRVLTGIVTDDASAAFGCGKILPPLPPALARGRRLLAELDGADQIDWKGR
jgi:hypothetical protein